MKNWKTQIQDWVRLGQLADDFYLETVTLARKCLQDTKSNCQEALDLADELLASLRQRRGKMIETKTLFYREMKRLAIRWNRSPDEINLRDTLSQAMRDMEREGRVRRVTSAAAKNNTNDVLWSSALRRYDQRPLDQFDFERRSLRLRMRFRKPWKSRTGTRQEKLLSPEDAKQLLTDLLAIAAGPILFRDLFSASLALVMVPKRSEIEQWEEICDAGLLNPSEYLLVEDSIADIVKRVWRKIVKAGATEALCGYILPKFLHDASVQLADLGAAQRVDESVWLVKSFLAHELDPKQFTFQSDQADLVRAVATGVFQALEKKCSENREDPRSN
jgi:hypothetical protein